VPAEAAFGTVATTTATTSWRIVETAAPSRWGGELGTCRRIYREQQRQQILSAARGVVVVVSAVAAARCPDGAADRTIVVPGGGRPRIIPPDTGLPPF
jgi:hypothetical protein